MVCLTVLQRNKALKITCRVNCKTLNWTAVVKRTGQVFTLTECPKDYDTCQDRGQWNAIAYTDMNKPILHFDKVTSKLFDLDNFTCNIGEKKYPAEGCTNFQFEDDGPHPSVIITVAVGAIACILMVMLIIYVYMKVNNPTVNSPTVNSPTVKDPTVNDPLRNSKRKAGDPQTSDDKFRDDLQEAGPDVESVIGGGTLQADAAPSKSLTAGSTPQADNAPSKSLTPEQLMYLENIIHFEGRLTPERREDLAKELNVDERAIKDWVKMTRDYPFF